MSDDRQPSSRLIETEQDRLLDFVESATIGLHWVGPDGTILWANPADYEPLGYTAQEYIGRNIVEFHADAPVIEDILARLGRGERIQEYEARLRCKDGSVRTVRITSSVLFDEHGKFVHTRCFTRDVTALRNAEREAERRAEDLQRITDALPALVAHVGLDGRYRFVNAAYLRWFEISHEEAVGRSLQEVLGDEAVARLRPHLDRAIAGEHVDFEAEVPYRRRGTRHIRASYVPTHNRDGQRDGFIALVEDVTPEKRSRDRVRLLSEASDLLASSLDFEQTLASLADLCVPRLADWCAIEMISEDGESEQLAVAHVDPDKVELARILRQRYPPDPEASRGVSYVLRTGKPDYMEEIPKGLVSEVARDADHERTLRALGLHSYVAVPIALRGRILGALTLVSAESERCYTAEDVEVAQELARRAAQAIENAQLYGRAQEATRRKDEFLAMLGHELRNPLAPIRTALDVMRLDEPRSSIKAREVIERQVDHLVRLVDDLLDISRLTRGKVRLDRTNVEIADVVREAIEMANPLLEDRAQHLSIEVPARGLVVRGDSVRLAQVFSNLLTNAAKYTERGGHITVRARIEGGEIVTEVEDDGIGIEPALLPVIFDLFSQSPQSVDRAMGGLGIGLTLAKSLVSMHDGTITAHSQGPGEGSTFSVRLPRSTTPPGARESARAQPVQARVERRRVLVVDDNQDAAQMLAAGLRAAHHDVVCASDGPTALASVEEYAPDVAIVDIGLPVMDGYDLAARLRRKAPSLRMIAMTGYGLEADRDRSKAAGFERHLVKPVSLDTVLQALK